MEVEFREAIPADIDRICSINRASIKQLGDGDYDKSQISAWAGAVEPDLYPIEASDTYFLIVETGAEVVGFGWMKSEADEYFTASVDGEITGMYISPSVAGTGIGTQLYAELERFARDTGNDSLGLWASLNAVSFYEKHDYTRVTDQVIEYEEAEVPAVEMKKFLD